MIEKGTKTFLVCNNNPNTFEADLNASLERLYKKGYTVVDIKFGGFSEAVSALILFKENTND